MSDLTPERLSAIRTAVGWARYALGEQRRLGQEKHRDLWSRRLADFDEAIEELIASGKQRTEAT